MSSKKKIYMALNAFVLSKETECIYCHVAAFVDLVNSLHIFLAVVGTIVAKILKKVGK
jgi:hypothetical protein